MLLEIELPNDYIPRLQRGTRSLNHYFQSDWKHPRYMNENARLSFNLLVYTTYRAAWEYKGDVLKTYIVRQLFAMLKRLEKRFDLTDLAALRQATYAFRKQFDYGISMVYDEEINKFYNAVRG